MGEDTTKKRLPGAINIITWACDRFCNEYCKMPIIHPLEGSGLDEDDWLKTYCDNCPLDMLNGTWEETDD